MHPSVIVLKSSHGLSASEIILAIFSDVLALRGGQVWIGDLIATCARLGVNESGARTAVSRLAAAGTLAASRDGRRSFYALAPAARRAADDEAPLVYAAPRLPALRGWLLVPLPERQNREAERDRLVALLLRERFGVISPCLALRPDRGEPAPRIDAPLFRGEATGELGPLLSRAWKLDALGARIDRLIDRIAAVDPSRIEPEDALALRLALVASWRPAALEDPRLPPEHEPPGWPAARARLLFGALYRELSPAADAAASRFVDAGGPLRLSAAAARTRRDMLEGRGPWSPHGSPHGGSLAEHGSAED